MDGEICGFQIGTRPPCSPPVSSRYQPPHAALRGCWHSFPGEAGQLTQNQLASTYSISINELIVIVLFFEYLGIIKMRKILTENNCCVPLKSNDESLLLKYSLVLSNKFDYDTITKRIGLNSDKELLYMSNNYLMPGIILKDKILYYVGDVNE